ncbi:hypothetical protein WR25_27099 [Diploscapter pachys]|uniref:Uncharacterized protein n=1 Tax=Diploscapter pachys TaxID=2018661 RepID=A0A2A2KKD7_9BILA|nr:hypothetical protein WR25_27099 [Diploscapter pachys]
MEPEVQALIAQCAQVAHLAGGLPADLCIADFHSGGVGHAETSVLGSRRRRRQSRWLADTGAGSTVALNSMYKPKYPPRAIGSTRSGIPAFTPWALSLAATAFTRCPPFGTW